MTGETVYNRFVAAVERWPERPMLAVVPETAKAYGIEPEEITYEDAEAEVEYLIETYQAAGYQKGHRVLVLLENRPAYFFHWLALNALGVSIVPVNPDLRGPEIAHLIEHAQPAGALSIDSRAADLSRVGPVFGPIAEPFKPVRGPTAVEGEAAMLYTSGTTGTPKGCVLRNDYFTLSGDWYREVGGLCALKDDGERMITPLPVFHMNAMACSFMAMITMGGCLIVLDRFHPRTWWQTVRKSRATCMHYLGIMPSILMKEPEAASDRDHSLRFGFGAGIDPDLHAPFESRFGIPLVEAWAMTETGALNAISNHTEPRLVGESCLGAPSSLTEIKIVGESGDVVTTGEPGELLIRARGDDPRRGFFAEYFADPDATDEAWQDGWFHTGDLVRQDDKGRIFFVDRAKNIIRRSGENISAVDVESVLMRHPSITAAAVAPVHCDIRGEEVLAILTTPSPSIELAEEIVAWCLEQMAYYKAPGYVAFVDTLPLTATQKLHRATLKELAADLADHPDTINTTHMKRGRQSSSGSGAG